VNVKKEQLEYHKSALPNNFMRELICDVVNYSAWSCDVGNIGVGLNLDWKSKETEYEACEKFYTNF